MSTDTVVRVDPKTLLVGANVRKEVNLDKAFVDSIKETGVLTPISAYESPEGLVVVDGQRRTLAAVDLAIETVPVWVTVAPSEQERIVGQVVVNERRSDLTLTDAIAAVQELALFNVKAPAIAKVTGLEKEFVQKAVSVGSSKAATKALKQEQLSFDSAVLIAEFDEFPEQQKQLLELKQDWQVREAATKFRRERQTLAVEEALRAAGVEVIKEPDYYQSDPIPVRDLYTDKKLTKDLDEVPHEKLVELAGDGLCGYAVLSYESGVPEMAPAYAVRGWAGRGLFTHQHRATGKAELTPEDKEAAKQERRVARERTKAWVEVAPLRMEFLQGLVARKTMPKGWEPFVADRLLHSAGSYSTSQLRMMIAILKLKESSDSYSFRGVVQKYLEGNPAKALQVMLAVELGCVEGGFEFDRKGWEHRDTKEYLIRLEGWGYVLSEPELLVVGRKKPKAAA